MMQSFLEIAFTKLLDRRHVLATLTLIEPPIDILPGDFPQKLQRFERDLPFARSFFQKPRLPRLNMGLKFSPSKPLADCR
jgi:hypothetical protein